MLALPKFRLAFGPWSILPKYHEIKMSASILISRVCLSRSLCVCPFLLTIQYRSSPDFRSRYTLFRERTILFVCLFGPPVSNFTYKQVRRSSRKFYQTVASLGLVSPGTATDGYHPIFLEKIRRPLLVIASESDDVFLAVVSSSLPSSTSYIQCSF